MLSSTQQILDRLAASTQDSIDALRKMNPEVVSNSPEVSKAGELIREAENSKHLLSALHDVTHRGEEVDSKLRQVSHDLSQFISTHVQQNLDLMLKTTDKQVSYFILIVIKAIVMTFVKFDSVAVEFSYFYCTLISNRNTG